MNLVELIADESEMKPSPCAYGNIVGGHACYCHHNQGPRKCPIWSNVGDSDPSLWKRGSFDNGFCPFFKTRK